MKITAMKLDHKVRKMKTDKAIARRDRSWKSQNISSQFHRNMEFEEITKDVFADSMAYMNEWLNHPFFPGFIGYRG